MGRQPFERSQFGGTADSPPACNNIKMEETAAQLRVGRGVFYCFDVLPFGLSSAPWLFTTVMGHCASALGYTVADLTCCSDNEIFGAGSARRPCSQSIGWLIRPTKCVGVSSAVQVFTALGTPALVAGRSLHERRAAGPGQSPSP